MSTTTDPAASTSIDALSDKQHQILQYLHQHASEKTYFKSRHIATDLDLSAKEVGTNMPAVTDAATELSIEKWGYSSGTTWMVTA